MEKKSNNWLSRLKYLKIRRRNSSNSRINCTNEDNLQQRHLSTFDNGNLSTRHTSRLQRRSSFQRSIINIQCLVRNVFRPSRDYSGMGHPGENSHPSSSHMNSRITLNTPVRHVENEYTLEPAETVNSFQEDRVPEIPPRLNLEATNEIGSSSSTTPVITPRSRNFPQLNANVKNGCVPKNEVANLSRFYWYWGPITKAQAEEKLKDLPEGAFLVRDSCSERYIFTISFQNVGKTLHARIDLSKSGYSLFDQTGYSSIAELVEDAVAKSKTNIYCYTKPRDDMQPYSPVRLTLPVSRYDKVPTLKCLSRLIIKQFVINDDMEKLPLPISLIAYLKERQYL